MNRVRPGLEMQQPSQRQHDGPVPGLPTDAGAAQAAQSSIGSHAWSTSPRRPPPVRRSRPQQVRVRLHSDGAMAKSVPQEDRLRDRITALRWPCGVLHRLTSTFGETRCQQATTTTPSLRGSAHILQSHVNGHVCTEASALPLTTPASNAAGGNRPSVVFRPREA